MASFRQVTIVGLGLIGGSLGMVLKRRHLAKTVVGVSRSPATLRRARARGAIDVGTTDATRAVQDADIVVLATPVDAIIPSAKRLSRSMRPGAILTDVGSTKMHVVATLERSLPPHVAFVGGHPLAGSEARGIAAASPHLFDGALCVLTPTARTDRDALQRVTRLWKLLVRQVVWLSPAQHDRVLAGTSHLPHLLACCLSRAVSPAPLPQAPPNFLKMTRVAKSDPDLWDDIFVSNRAALLAAMDDFEREWRALRSLLARSRHAQLRRLLAGAKRRRDALKDRC